MSDDAMYCERCGAQVGNFDERGPEHRSGPVIWTGDGFWGPYWSMDTKTAAQLISAVILAMGIVMLFGFSIIPDDDFFADVRAFSLMMSLGMIVFGAAVLIITNDNKKKKRGR